MTRFACSVLSLVAVCAWASTVQTQDRFPNGAGKAELFRICGDCHEAEKVLAYPMTAREWTGNLNDMAQRGTVATDAEWEAIEQYLHKYIAIIPVNRASSDELARTMDVAQEVGNAIAAYRREHGAFKSTDELKRVPGLDAAKVDARKDRLIF